jgi:hypothetical protein
MLSSTTLGMVPQRLDQWGWKTVAFGVAKSDRFELTSTREFG